MFNLTRRSLSCTLSFGLLFGAAACAEAQIGVYAKVDITHQSDTQYAGDPTTSQTFYGGDAGFYDDFVHVGPLSLGTDFRGGFVTGGNYHYRSFLGGVRLAVKPPVIPLRPYVQFSVGVGGTRYTGTLSSSIPSAPYDDKLLYEFLGGIDCTILPHVDWRAVEIGVGHQNAVNYGTAADNLVLVSSGLVLRF